MFKVRNLVLFPVDVSKVTLKLGIYTLYSGGGGRYDLNYLYLLLGIDFNNSMPNRKC